MKLKKKLLLTAMSTLLFSSSIFADDSEKDIQKMTVIVPEVSLIDVSGDLTVKLTPPTEAGKNFEDQTVVEGKPTYDISANIAVKDPKSTKKIVATLGEVPAGWKVILNSMDAPTGATSVTSDLTLSSGSGVDTVTNIQNVAESGLGMQLSIGPEDAGTMPSFTDDSGQTIEIVYTITAG